jgi:glycine cleavage system transcriptional repressor
VSEAVYAVTVVGRDRPGIIAETTARLAHLGLNLEDTTMTLLRGHFAMMLVCAGEAGARDIEDALAPLTIDRSLRVTVAEVPAEPSPPSGGSPWVLTVHGSDRPGIVAAVVAEVAAVKGNITDLTTRLAGARHLLVAEIDVPSGVDVAALKAAVDRVASGLGVEATLLRVDVGEPPTL